MTGQMAPVGLVLLLLTPLVLMPNGAMKARRDIMARASRRLLVAAI